MSHRRHIPQHPLASPRRITQTKKTCGKRRFNTEMDAKLEIMRFQRIDDPGRDKLPCRAYLCPECAGWHLTSRPLAVTPPGPENDGCVKAAFDTEELAKKRLAEIQEHPRPGPVPCRTYRCPRCSKWHFSRQPLLKERTACGKMGWLYEEGAQSTLDQIRDNPRPGYTIPKDIEYCEACSRWHLVH